MPSWVAGLVVAVVVLAAATVVGLLWQRRNGRLRTVEGSGPVPEREAEAGVLTRLGVPADAPVTLLQFSSAFCAPCRATRRICTEVGDQLDGVVHLEVDAESHLDEVRALDVMRTPTLFVIGAGRRIVQRASGAPSKPQLIAAIAPLLTEPANAGRTS